MASLPRLGNVVLGLGILGIVRVVPEMVSLWSPKTVYWIVVVLDVSFAIGMILAGAGLRRGDPRSPRLALLAAGVTVSTSIGWGLLIAHELGWNRHSALMMPRMVFYVLSVGFWPYGAWAIVRASVPESRRSLWGSFGGSLTIGGVLMSVLYYSFR